MTDETDRHSRAFEAELIEDPDELAAAEARNGLRQFDAVVEIVEFFQQPERTFKLRPSHLLHLHRIALEGISAYAGNFRPAGIEIGGSKHQPVGAHLVPAEVEQLCDYVNDNWQTQSPLHLTAYVLWRLNWIHPFTDGNGRTARALSYLVLCLRLGYLLPGTNTIPEQISLDKRPTIARWNRLTKPGAKVNSTCGTWSSCFPRSLQISCYRFIVRRLAMSSNHPHGSFTKSG